MTDPGVIGMSYFEKKEGNVSIEKKMPLNIKSKGEAMPSVYYIQNRKNVCFSNDAIQSLFQKIRGKDIALSWMMVL